MQEGRGPEEMEEEVSVGVMSRLCCIQRDASKASPHNVHCL